MSLNLPYMQTHTLVTGQSRDVKITSFHTNKLYKNVFKINIKPRLM